MPAMAWKANSEQAATLSQSGQTVECMEAGPQKRRLVSKPEGRERSLHTRDTAGCLACLCPDFTGHGSAFAGGLTLQPLWQCAPQGSLSHTSPAKRGTTLLKTPPESTHTQDLNSWVFQHIRWLEYCVR